MPGNHFFGQNHNQADGEKNPFSAAVNERNMCVLVPEVYRDDLVNGMVDVLDQEGKPFETVMNGNGCYIYKVRNTC